MHSGDDLFYEMGSRKKVEDHSEIQLHNIKPQEHYIEAQVQEGDTLQAISLRFHCPISELKRINQIHKNNEIFARRTIKVPVTPFSVLTEMTQFPTSSESAPPVSSQSSNHLQDLLQSNTDIDNKLKDEFSNINKSTHCAVDCNAVVMNSTLAPSLTPYTDGELLTDAVTEDTQLLPNKDKIPVETIVVKQLTSQGADFGIKWHHLVCFILIVIVVVPLVLIILNVHKSEINDGAR